MDRRISARRLGELLDDRGAGRPAYQWLADGVRQLVADGRLLHDTRLPSERELVGELGVSRTTVTRAYGVLRDRGFASARQGSGTVVQVPGGPVAGGGEPLPTGPVQPIDVDAIDLTCSAPPAAPGLASAYARAVERMPSFVAGAGYFPLGISELREAIADRFVARGVPTDPDQVIVTTGALAALAAVFRAVLRRGDPVVVESPTYPNALSTLQHAGARVVGAPLIPADRDEVTAVHRRVGARMMLAMPDFHNPTGLVWSESDRDRVARVWREAGAIGLVDETMSETWLDAEPDVRPMAAHAPDCVTVGSASKTLWGGLRIGWIRAPHALIGAIARARTSLDLGAPVLEQLVVADQLERGGGLSAESRRRLIAARAALLRLGERCPGWEVDTPSGGLNLWWRLPQPRSTALVAVAERHGVLLAPGSLFAVDGAGLEARVRTPYAVDELVAAEAVDRIAAAWAQVSSAQ
ncbi:PLP-dependent aminotransferase family protein [Flexivirga caeni]|nr:PLP-dependent aminotransferase family protein [Flexivirga caeni]